MTLSNPTRRVAYVGGEGRSSLAVAAVAILASMAFGARAQEPVFGESVEVRVSTVDVVVTAKDGRHIEGLTPEDFELLVDGSRETITAFDEIRIAPASAREAAPASMPAAAAQELTTIEPPRRRHIVFFIDLYSLDAQRRGQAITALRGFLRKNWSPGDEAMIALWNRDLQVPLTFTRDLETVDREMDAITQRAGGGIAEDRRITEMRIRAELQGAEVAHGSPYVQSMRKAYQYSLYFAQTFAEEQANRTESLAESLEAVMRGIAGMDGKKIVVIVGENFPEYPGLGMYEYVNELFAPYSSVLVLSPSQTLAAKRSLYSLVPRLARAANRNEITLHTIFSGEAASETSAERERQTMVSSRFVEFSNSAASFGSLSRETGGIALLGSRNFELATERMGADLDHYYTLVWRSRPGSNGTRDVEVRTRDASLTVRVRRQVLEKSASEEVEDRVVSHLYEQVVSGESEEMRVSAGRPARRGRKRLTVPVEVEFPASLLTMKEDGANESGSFDVVIAASDALNRLSGVTRKTTGGSWRKGEVPPRIRYSVDVVVREGEGMISVAVVDAWSGALLMKRVAIPR